MRRILSIKRSKKAMTLVELIVAMALTAIFAGSCVLLIAPVTRIYQHVNNLSRAQLVADSVVGALRSECEKAMISDSGDVWIANIEDDPGQTMTAPNPQPSGNVLVFRRNGKYCETISSDYEINSILYQGVIDREKVILGDDVTEIPAGMRSVESIYNTDDAKNGYIHFGYFESGAGLIEGIPFIYPSEYYDYTNPFTSVTYLNYKIELKFYNLMQDSSYRPAYVICDVSVKSAQSDEIIYTRSAVLCFS